MLHRWHLLLIPCVLLLMASSGQAQPWCFGSYTQSYLTGSTCSTTPLTLSAVLPCTGCSDTWSGSPVAGQGTRNATYQWSPAMGWGHTTAYINLDVYNPNPGCIYGEIWDVGIGAQPNIALPTLQNGPWNGDTSKTWIYARNYLNPAPLVSGSYSFTPSWSALGGTVLQQRHTLSGPFYYDTAYVKWSGPVPLRLQESQVTNHQPATIMVNFNCNWSPAPSQMAYPSLAIFHNGLVCTGSPQTFFTFPFANSIYTWSATNGSVVSGQGTNSAQLLLSGPGTVTVVRDSSGILTTANLNVTTTTPTVNLGPDQTVCPGTPVTLNAGPGYSQYSWSNGATTQSIVVTTPGTYFVAASTSGNCIARDTIQINHIPANPTNLGPDIHTCTFPVTLNAGPGFTAYNWSTGATTQTIAAAAAGIYSVTVTNPNSCTDADTVLVYNNQTIVSLPPTATFCYPGSTTLNPTYINASNYLWSTGATTPNLTVNSPGTQTIWIQASNSYGCMARDTITVSSLPRPTPNLGPDQTICPGTSTTFNAGPGYTNYFWSTFVNTQSITASLPGAYRVTVTAANGCTGSDTVQLYHYPFTPVNLGPDINVCVPSATLNAGSGYATYNWSTGATTQSIVVTNTGSYRVTVVDANGCTDADTIQVNFVNFTMSLGPNVTVCEPQSVTLDPQLVGVFSYNWSTGAATPTVTLSTPGAYTVSLSASNAYGCVARDTVSVTIMPTPPSLLGNDTILCADTSITLDMGPAFGSYLWSTGATTQSITVANGGVYAITATAANGCVRLDTVLISDLIDCVFPGDVNYDLSVDLLDVLALGTTIGQTGPARPAASLIWYGQQCSNWLWNVTSGVNAKQADTDGNGTIAQLDTLAIQQNFGNIHTRFGSVTGNNGQVRIVPQQSSVMAGDIAYFDVFYEGQSGTNLDSVYGLSLQLQWPNTGISAPGLVSADFIPTWFAPGVNHMDFTRTSSNSAYLAVSRTSGTNVSGQGLAMRLAFQTDSALAPGNTVSFAPQVVACTGSSNDYTLRVPTISVLPTQITGTVAVSNPIYLHAIVMPIPADDHILVQVDGIASEGTLQLLNMMGQVLVEVPISQDQPHSFSTSELPSGTYGIRIQTARGSYFRKVPVRH